MKKASAMVLSIVGALAVIAAINPTMLAYAQNSVTADQSNSFTADVSQSQSQSAATEESDEYDGSIDQEADQGFCLQVNQQNAAAGDDATNTATNEISDDVDCS